MAIDFNNPTAATNSNNGDAKQRPASMLWLNIGVYMPVEQADGSTDEEFVSLPLGVGLDTMEPMKGNSPLAKRKNALLNHLQKAVKAGVAAGESQKLNGVFLEATHVDPSKNGIPADVQEAVEKIQLSFG